MAKKYVIKDAELNCEFGSKSSKLKPLEDRHVMVGKAGKLMANEVDIERSCMCGGFGICRSPYTDTETTTGEREKISSQNQLVPLMNMKKAEGSKTVPC